MILTVKRTDFNPKATIGELLIDGARECFTLEDEVRVGPKIQNATAIPFGHYEVIVDFSNRFQRVMPHVLNVPGFTGIRMHWGNSDVDTDGCILLGETKVNEDFIGQSRVAFDAFFPKLALALKTEQVFIDIIDGREAVATGDNRE